VEARVTYDYEPEQPDELRLKVGEIVKNIEIQDGGWWEGEVNGVRGMFPENFVDKIESDTNNSEGQGLKKGKKVRVTFQYEAEQPDELNLEVGEIVEIVENEDEGWCKGQLNGKEGMFPVNFVEEYTEEEKAKPADVPKPIPEPTLLPEPVKEETKRPVSGMGFGLKLEDLSKFKLKKTGKGLGSDDQNTTTSESKPNFSIPKKEDSKTASVPVPSLKLPTPDMVTKTVEKARVLFSYEPEQEDELKLVVGEILTLTNKDVFDGWMEGELHGKRGIFPDNFVEMMPPEQIKVEASEANNKPIRGSGSIKRAAKSPPVSPVTQEPMKLPEPLVPEAKAPAPQPSHKGVSVLPPGGLIGIGPGALKKTDHSKKGDASRPPPPDTTKKPIPGGKGPAPAPPALSTKPKPALPVAPKPSKPAAPKPGSKTPDDTSSVPGFLRTPSIGSSTRANSVPAKPFSKDSTDGPPKPVFPRANSLSRPPAVKTPSRVPSVKKEEKSQDDHALLNGHSDDKSDDLDLDAVKPTDQLKGVQRVKGPNKNPPSKYSDKKKKHGSMKASNTNKEPGPARPSPPQNVVKSETVATSKDAKAADEVDNGKNNAAASAATKAALDESAKEIASLKSQVSGLETKMAEMEKRFKKLLLGVTDDLESERKQRLNQQVEIDSLRKKLDILGQ